MPASSSKQGRVLLDADINELVGDRRPPPARAGQRRARPRHGLVDHAATPSRSPSPAARCRSATAACTSTACWPRTMAHALPTRRNACSTVCSPRRDFADAVRLRGAALSARSARAADGGPPSGLSRRLGPRGHASRAARPGRERGRRRHDARASRRSGRCACSRDEARRRHDLRNARRRCARLERR